MKTEKVVIGWSENDRAELEGFDSYFAFIFKHNNYFLIKKIKYIESNGYTVTFHTNLFRRLFCKYKYKIVASK